MKLNPYDKYTSKRLDKINAKAELTLGKSYANLYAKAKADLAELFATLPAKPILEDARRYGRLDNLLKTLRSEYLKLGSKNVKQAELLSSTNYVESYMAGLWAAEEITGPWKWKNPTVEAIRASVYWEGTGLDLPKRFGVNITGELAKIEAEITRGLATGQGYAKTAAGLKDQFEKGYNDALRVVRTESTRNRGEGYDSAFQEMVDQGLPVRKIWISATDDRTRDTHQYMDQRLSDAKGIFDTPWGDSTGPGDGPASEVINCRCRTVTVFDDEPTIKRQDVAPAWKEWAENLGWTEEGGWPRVDMAVR